MKQNKHNRKDDLSSVDSTKRIYKMYKRKKNWVIAPVIFGLLAPTLIAGPVTVLAEEGVATTAEAVPAGVIAEDTLEPIRQNAEGIIGGINELSLKDRDAYLALLAKDKVQTADDVYKVVSDAYNQQTSEIKEAFDRWYEKEINDLQFLTKTDKANFISQVVAAIGPGGFPSTIGYGPTEASLAMHELEYNKYLTAVDNLKKDEGVQKVLADAKEKNAGEEIALNGITALKEAKMKEVDSLPYLSDNEKDTFKSAIDAVISGKVDDVITEYQKAVQRSKDNFDAQLDTKKQDLLDKIQYSNMQTRLNTASGSTLGNDIVPPLKLKVQNATTFNALAAIEAEIDSIIEGLDNGTISSGLGSAKVTAIATVNSDAVTYDIPTKDAKVYIDRINAATTEDAVDKVMADWKADLNIKVLEKETVLADAQSKAEGMITGLRWLSDSVKINYTDRVNAVKTVKEVIALVKEAQADNEAERVRVTNEIASERGKATKTINDMKFIGAQDKIQQLGKVAQAKDLNAIQLALKEAINLDGIAEHAYLKDKADTIIDNLQYLVSLGLTSAAKTYPPVPVTGAPSYEPLSNAARVQFANAIRAAIIKNTEEGIADASTITEAGLKQVAKDGIDALPNLTDKQKIAAKKDVDDLKWESSTTPAAFKVKVKAIFDDAVLLDKNNAEKELTAKGLADAKAEAIRELDTFTYLSDSVRNLFKADVNNASTIPEILPIMTKASNENASIQGQVQAVEAEKSLAITALSKLDRLSASELAKYRAEVIAATTKEAVNNILNRATEVNTNRLLNGLVDLDKIEAEVRDAIINLDTISGGLSIPVAPNSVKENLLKEVTTARGTNDKAKIIAVYTKAVKLNTKKHDESIITDIKANFKNGGYVLAQKNISKLRDDKVRKDYQAQLDTLVGLAKAKADAYVAIDDLVGMSKTEKEAAKDKVSKMETKEEIDKYVKELIAADNKENDGELIKLAESQIRDGKFDEAAKTIAKVKDKDEKARLTERLSDAKNMPKLSVQSHVAYKGWMGAVGAGEVSGTTGASKQMEAVKINLGKSDVKGGIEYRSHVAYIGWMKPVANGAMSGTSGQAKRMEAIEIKLTGDMAKKYDVYYRSHVAYVGWQGWVSNGAVSGTTGKSKQMEAIQIKLVLKGDPAPK